MKSIFLKVFFFILIVSSLQACGWRLRGASELPSTIKFAFIKGAAEFSQLAQAIKQQITSSGAKIVTEADEDTIHFVVVVNKFNRRVSSVNSSGNATEYGLTYDLAIRVLDGQGKLLVKEYEVNLNRIYTYDATQALANSNEEESIKSQMISFAVRQAMRRIGVKLRNNPAFKEKDKTNKNQGVKENDQSQLIKQ